MPVVERGELQQAAVANNRCQATVVVNSCHLSSHSRLPVVNLNLMPLNPDVKLLQACQQIARAIMPGATVMKKPETQSGMTRLAHSSRPGTQLNPTAQRRSVSCSSDEIELNGNNVCTGCLNTVHGGDRYLKCDICCQRVHLDSTSVPARAHDALAEYIAIIGFVCEECRQSMKTTLDQPPASGIEHSHRGDRCAENGTV